MAGRKVIRDKETGELKVVPRKGLPRADTVFRRLEKSIPKQEMLEILDSAPDERAHQLMQMMTSPGFRHKSLPQLAKECGLSYAQVLQFITRHRMDQGMLRMTSHAPQVMEDIAIDSKSRTVQCVTCRGTGQVEDVDRKTGEVLDSRTCEVCDGEGRLRKIGDADSRKLLFESLKLTGRGTGQMVQVNVGAGQSMEDTVASVREVLDVKLIEEPKE